MQRNAKARPLARNFSVPCRSTMSEIEPCRAFPARDGHVLPPATTRTSPGWIRSKIPPLASACLELAFPYYFRNIWRCLVRVGGTFGRHDSKSFIDLREAVVLACGRANVRHDVAVAENSRFRVSRDFVFAIRDRQNHRSTRKLAMAERSFREESVGWNGADHVRSSHDH